MPLYMALVIGSLIWATVEWMPSRDPLVGAFAFKQVWAALWAFFLLGYGPVVVGQVLPAVFIDRISSVVVIMLVATSVHFDRAVVAEYRVWRPGLAVERGLVWVAASCLVPLFSGYASYALEIASIVVCAHGMIALPLMVTSRPVRGDRAPGVPKPYVVGFYVFAAVPVTLTTLANLGLLHPATYDIRMLMVHGLVTSALMAVLLNVRARRKARAAAEAAMRLAASEEQARRERAFREDRDRMLAMLRHELKTPLAAISMLVAVEPTPDMRRLVGRAVADMRAVVDRGVQMGQIEERALASVRARCDFDAELAAALETAQDRGRLAVPPATGLALETDAQLLRTIVANLADNALKYSPPKSTVTMDVLETDAPPGIRLGCANLPGNAGWPDPKKLFTKYYRSPEARRQTGSGLGLYLAAELARELGGRLSYAPTPTHVRFELWLPH